MTGSPRPIHVLVVDDEPALRKVFRTSLTASGFVIEEARSGEEAVDLLPQRPFDLVLLDINMPGIGGVEACREIRALAPKIGILMVTVRDAEHDMVLALEAGADDYVTKPVRFRELVARMRAVLRRLDAGSATEPAVIRVADLEMDHGTSQGAKSRRTGSLDAEGIRVAGAVDEESWSSRNPRQAAARRLGTGVRNRTRLLTILCQNTPQEN